MKNTNPWDFETDTYKCSWELGEEVFVIEPQYNIIRKDKIQMIGFTTRGVRIKLSNYHPHNKDFSEKYVFKTKEKADLALKV